MTKKDLLEVIKKIHLRQKEVEFDLFNEDMKNVDCNLEYKAYCGGACNAFLEVLCLLTVLKNKA